MDTPHHVEIELLGQPRVRLNGASLDLAKWQKPMTLLFYLAVASERRHTREELAALFWPDAATSAALRNLRQLLYRLRQALEDNEAARAAILSEEETLDIDPEADVRVDISAFQALYDEVQTHNHRRTTACGSCVVKLERALARYRGAFLRGWDVGGSEALETWALLKREFLRRQAHLALHVVAAYRLNHGHYEVAGDAIRRLLEFDPWDEAAERLLLRLLAASGERSAALVEYRRFREALHTELGVTPEDATQALVARISAGERPGAAAEPVVLPALPGPFIGRETELAQLEGYLADRDHRLLTILGTGGSGKTWLALQAAHRQLPDWRHGVRFVPLAEVRAEAGESLAEAMVTALGLPGGGAQSQTSRLINYLREREMLLILDNLEHLLPQIVPLVRRILQYAPRVKVLATSQARLATPEEWIVSLDGLSFPGSAAGDGESTTLMERYDAVRLFAHHAQRVNPRWRLDAENQADVARICRAVEGLPLGVELAAGWVRGLSAREIAQEIGRNLDFLRRSRAHGPERQQGLRGAYAYAYGLLSEREQRLFRALSVFQGGFETEAAEQVAGATLSGLARLLDQSLLRLSVGGRWDLHPLLRRYGAERLDEHDGEAAEIRERHARYYADWLAAREDALWGRRPQGGVAAIAAEWDNVRAGWLWAVSHQDTSVLTHSLDPLTRYFELRGTFHRGATLFGSAATELEDVPQLAGGCPSLIARLLAAHGHFLTYRAAYAKAVASARRGAQLAERAGDRKALVSSYLTWGEALRHQGNNDAARALLAEALEMSRSLGLVRSEAEALRLLGTVLWRQSEFQEAQARFEAALALDRRLGDYRGEGWTLNALALVLENSDRYDRAIPVYREALSVMRDIGDRWGESIVLGNLGYIYARVGRPVDARRCYERDLRICRELGDRRGESWTLGYLSLLEHQRGRHQAAERYARRALARARELDHAYLTAGALTHLGHALAGREAWADAELVYEQALEIRRELEERALALETLAGLIRVDLGRGDLAQAIARAEELLTQLADQSADRTDEQLRIYLACYRALDAAGDPRAAEVLASAQALLTARADRIEDRELRRAFLEDVAVHREICRLPGQR
jgi:predicted ATPase/DNA-binding SARP family transcriptional activator